MTFTVTLEEDEYSMPIYYYKYKKLLEVINMIAAPSFCTGEDAESYQHWAQEVLDEIKEMGE